jgi:hypothetical protein
VIFQRLHAKETYPGTGIGLALCKKIVEFHGGHIWLDTAVEQGTAVCWTLPVPVPDDETPADPDLIDELDELPEGDEAPAEAEAEAEAESEAEEGELRV